jgi:hypothetical protein
MFDPLQPLSSVGILVLENQAQGGSTPSTPRAYCARVELPAKERSYAGPGA